MICRFGAPEVVITDQGREFVNELTKELFQITKTQHRVTSAYHPQVFIHVHKINLSRIN